MEVPGLVGNQFLAQDELAHGFAGNPRSAVAITVNKEHDRLAACGRFLDHRELKFPLGSFSLFAAFLYLRAAIALGLFFALFSGLGEDLCSFPIDRR